MPFWYLPPCEHVLCTRFDDFCCSMLLPTGNSRIPCLSTPHLSPHTRSAGIYGPSPASIYSFWSVQLLPPAHRSHWNAMLLFPPPVYNLRLQPLVFPLHWYPALTLTLWCMCVGPRRARQCTLQCALPFGTTHATGMRSLSPLQITVSHTQTAFLRGLFLRTPCQPPVSCKPFSLKGRISVHRLALFS